MPHIESSQDEHVQPPLTVLVVDDEESIVELIKLGLRYENFHVESAEDGKEGINAAQRLNPAMIILDVALPGDIDGVEVCRRLRQNPTTQDIPVLMLTAKRESQDKVMGLNTGADDYLVKPFNFDELVARIRAILRREQRSSQKDDAQSDQVLKSGDLRMNLATRELTVAGRPTALTTTEFNLLHLFMSHPNHVLDRQTILNRVWGYDFMGETNIIEVYVRYLREKIEETPASPRYIQTVRGIGYIFKGE
jgi:two-component system, OmpR family, response regulator MprA